MLYDKKDVRLIGTAIVITAFITMFYDLIQYGLRNVWNDAKAEPLVMVISMIIAIFAGLMILKYYIWTFNKMDDNKNKN